MGYYVYDRIKQINGQLFILRKNIKEETLEVNKIRAHQQIVDMLLLLREGRFQNTRGHNLDLVEEIMQLQLDKIETAANKEALEKIIDRVVNLFVDGKNKDDLMYYSRASRFKDMLQEKKGVNPLINQIKNERPLNVLCYDVPAEYVLSRDIKNPRINSYGIVIGRVFYTDILQNVAYGSGGNSSISNGAFDALMVATNSTATYEPVGFRGDVIPKSEYLSIVSSFVYLRTDGLLCIQIPYTRLDHDLCHYLARNLRDIRVSKINDIMVEVTGLKKAEKVFTPGDYNTLRNIYKEINSLPTVLDYKYELPQSIKVIANFRGSRVTKEMLQSAKSKSTALSKIIATSNHTNDLSNHKPLLPFNTGQIGLVLSSGCLDGVVEEDEESCHLIKGKVERKTVVKKGSRSSEDSITVYHSVQINALTQSGKLIQIS